MLTVALGLWGISACDGSKSSQEDTGPDPPVVPGREVGRGLALAGTLAGELAGVAVGGDFDLDGDGQADVAVGAMLSDAKVESAGRACVFLGPVDHDTTLKEADSCWTGVAENHLFGRDVEGLGDLDGDGFDELGLGAVHHDEGGANSGMIVVIWGAADPEDWQTTEVTGTDPGGHVGLRFTALPGDQPRFLAGAHEANLDANDGEELRGEGVAWIVSAPERGDPVPIDGLSVRWTGIREDDRLGVTVASPGDLDGDGLSDALLGASQARTLDDGPQVGAVYVDLAPFDQGGSVADADAVVHGEHDLAWFGWSVAGLGDVDGDGLADFAVGAFKDTSNGADAGAVYVFSGLPWDGAGLSSAAAILLGEVAGDKAGEVLEPAGDLDGDGAGELLVGAPTAGHVRTWAGALYVVRGPFLGQRALDPDIDDLWIGTQDLQFVGASAAAAGDAGGDGRPDLLVGAMGDSASTGAAYLLLEAGW